MAIYALADLHLAISEKNKSMDVFGKEWENYMERIKENWNSIVKPEDTVIVSGDISWAMYLEDAIEDFKFINNLPGTKIISKGNHDFWWESLTKLNNFLKENKFDTIKILHNNCIECDDYVICGTRGWIEEEKKIFDRELIRLELSLKESEKFENKKKIVSIHYPPFNEKIIELMKKYNVEKCVYGHLHGVAKENIKNGIFEGIEINCVSADYLDFMPIKIGG